MLDTAAREGGQLAWKELFDPAIKIGTEGFKISPFRAIANGGITAFYVGASST